VIMNGIFVALSSILGTAQRAYWYQQLSCVLEEGDLTYRTKSKWEIKDADVCEKFHILTESSRSLAFHQSTRVEQLGVITKLECLAKNEMPSQDDASLENYSLLPATSSRCQASSRTDPVSSPNSLV